VPHWLFSLFCIGFIRDCSNLTFIILFRITFLNTWYIYVNLFWTSCKNMTMWFIPHNVYFNHYFHPNMVLHQVTQNKLAWWYLRCILAKLTQCQFTISSRQQSDYVGCFNIFSVFRDTQPHYHTHNSLCASCYSTWTKKEQIGKLLIATQREMTRITETLHANRSCIGVALFKKAEIY